jgi:hypothetical protein
MHPSSYMFCSRTHIFVLRSTTDVLSSIIWLKWLTITHTDLTVPLTSHTSSPLLRRWIKTNIIILHLIHLHRMSAHIHRMVSLSHPMHWVMTHLHWVLSHSLHIHWMHWMVSHLPWIKSSTITSISSSSLLMMSSLMSHIYIMTILITTSVLHLSSIKLPIVISWSIASRFSRVRPPLSMHIHFLKLSLLIRVKFKLVSHHLWSIAVTLTLSSPLALSVPLVARTTINDPSIAIANRMFPWLSFIGTIVIARIIHLNLRSP